MKDESDPVTPDELVVRLIWEDYYKPELDVTVRDSAFAPKPNESDGISVFRVSCLTDPEDALAVIAPEKRGRYVLALLPVSEVLACGLTVVPTKIEGVAGHAVVPELNAAAVQTNKAHWRMVQKRLAVVASASVIRPLNG